MTVTVSNIPAIYNSCVRRAIRWALSEVNIWTVLFYTTDHNNMTDSVENKTDGVAETMNPSSLRI